MRKAPSRERHLVRLVQLIDSDAGPYPTGPYPTLPHPRLTPASPPTLKNSRDATAVFIFWDHREYVSW